MTCCEPTIPDSCIALPNIGPDKVKVPLSTPDSTKVAVTLKLLSTANVACTVSLPSEGQFEPPGATRHVFEKVPIVPEKLAGSAVVISVPEKGCG